MKTEGNAYLFDHKKMLEEIYSQLAEARSNLGEFNNPASPSAI